MKPTPVGAHASSEVRAIRGRDVVIAVSVLLVYPWLLHGLLLLLHIHPPRPTIRAVYSLLSEAPRAVAAAVLLTKWNWWRRTGWRAPDWRQMWLLWVPVALVVAQWTVLHPPNRAVVYTALATLFALAVGFTEETWFRGLLLEGLRSRGALQAVVVSAAAFGAFHLDSGFRGYSTVFRVFSAFGFGLVYGAARIRIGAIWPLILIHAAQDLPHFLVPYRATAPRPMPIYELEAAATVVGVLVVVGLVYAVVLTRRSRVERVRSSVEPVTSETTSG